MASLSWPKSFLSGIINSMKRFFLILFSCLVFFSAYAQKYAPEQKDPSYEHDKWLTLPRDIFYEFAAFSLSFDGDDDNDGDGIPDLWGIPEWVSFEIKRFVREDPLRQRPSWMTDMDLYARNIAPGDETYHVAGTMDLPEVKTDYRFVRGHMCPKETAERISREAAYNTHTLLNAVPQLQWQNNGIWKSLESLCNRWADTYGRIWVICGPVFFSRSPALWLGQGIEKKAAVPDALFKIVIREDTVLPVKTIAFIIPNILPKERQDLSEYISTIKRIESLTGLDFLTLLGPSQESVETRTGSLDEWQVQGGN